MSLNYFQLEIDYFYLVPSPVSVIQDITGPKTALKKIEQELKAGQEVIVSVFDNCKQYKGREVHSIKGYSQMNDPGVRIMDNALIEIYRWNPLLSKCELSKTISLDKYKSEKKPGEESDWDLYFQPRYIYENQTQYSHFNFKKNADDRPEYISSPLEIQTDIYQSIDLYNSLANQKVTRISGSPECVAQGLIAVQSMK